MPKTIKSSLLIVAQRSSHENIECVNGHGWKVILNLAIMCCKQLLDIIHTGPSWVHLWEHMRCHIVKKNYQTEVVKIEQITEIDTTF